MLNLTNSISKLPLLLIRSKSNNIADHLMTGNDRAAKFINQAVKLLRDYLTYV